MFENETEKILNEISQAEAFRLIGFSELYGGSINQVLQLETSEGKMVAKLNRAEEFPGMFEAEKMGLETLKNSKTFKIPTILSCGKLHDTAYLLLEYIPQGKPTSNFWTDFAEKLAKLHQHSNSYFGFSASNYIGSLPQYNKKESSATGFYISQRLEPQFKLASENGFSFNNLELVFKNISMEIPEEKPALIHGDLWNGNYLVSEKGDASLIDPAVCYGSREMDLAMMQLFGGFPEKFFAAYKEIFPLVSGFQNRVALWQLYYLLVHLNLFGSGYYPQVERIVQRFS